MILYRCFAHEAGANDDRPGGAIFFPREHQGAGRHDNPRDYGCLYVTESPVSAVVEQLAPFAGEPSVEPWMLRRRRLPLALVAIELADAARLVDLDRPPVLSREGLRPSLVATRNRRLTQPQALRIHRRRRSAAGIRWWSTFESLWANVTLFDRARRHLKVLDVRELTVDDPAVVAAAEALGLA